MSKPDFKDSSWWQNSAVCAVTLFIAIIVLMIVWVIVVVFWKLALCLTVLFILGAIINTYFFRNDSFL